MNKQAIEIDVFSYPTPIPLENPNHNPLHAIRAGYVFFPKETDNKEEASRRLFHEGHEHAHGLKAKSSAVKELKNWTLHNSRNIQAGPWEEEPDNDQPTNVVPTSEVVDLLSQCRRHVLKITDSYIAVLDVCPTTVPARKKKSARSRSSLKTLSLGSVVS